MDKIVILERLNLPSDRTYRFAMRIPVPAGNESMFANTDAISAYKATSDIDNDQLRGGFFVERVGVVELPQSRVTQDAFDATDPGNIANFQKQLLKDPNAVMPASRSKILVDTTIEDVKAAMVAEYAKQEALLAAQIVEAGMPHELDNYGLSFDGSVWSSK